MPLSTKLTELLGLETPIVSAPMDKASTAELAACVSGAGGLGLIGGGYGDRAWLDAQLNETRATGSPFGVGFITWSIDAGLMELALESQPVAVFLSFGDPKPYVDDIHAAGARLILQVHDLEHVRMAIDVGADIVCVQGGEAGGHGTGTRSTFTLVPESADLVRDLRPEVALLAAGGVADGRGLAAALALGADGVVVGTRFWATFQANVDEALRGASVRIKGDDTLRTSVYDIVRGKDWPPHYTGRVVRNEFVENWHGREVDLQTNLHSVRPVYEAGVAEGDPDIANVIVGESIGQVHAVRDAAEVVADMTSTALRILGGRAPQIG